MPAGPRQRLRFGRAQRIARGGDFLRIRQQGQRLAHGCLVANWQRLPPGAGSRLGIIAGGKLGPAVVRNRARRLLREVFRLHQHELAQPCDLVLVARPSIVRREFVRVEQDFLETLRRAGLRKPTPAPPAP